MKGYIKEYVVYSTQVLVVLLLNEAMEFIELPTAEAKTIIVRRISLHQESRQKNRITLGMCRASSPWMSRNSHNKPAGMWSVMKLWLYYYCQRTSF